MSARRLDDLHADLLGFCDEVIAATKATTKERFLDDLSAIRAMERRLELIGEVATRLGDDVPDADVDWQDLRGLRIMLAHVYNRILPERLWSYATSGIPRIRAALGD